MSFKKFLVPLLLLVGVFQSFANDTITSFNAEKVLRSEYVRSPIASLDTIGGADSVVILKKGFTVSEGWNYVLKIPTITGGGSDSVKYSVITRYFDPKGVLQSTTAWAISVATSVDLLLPINRSGVGTMYEVVMKGVTDNGGQHIFTGLWVYKVSNPLLPK